MRKPRKSWYAEINDKYEWLVTKCKLCHSYDVNSFSDKQKDAFRYFCSRYNTVPPSTDLLAALAVVTQNHKDLNNSIDEYFAVTSVYDKIRLTKGVAAANEYRNKIATSNKTKNKNSCSPEFWEEKGYSREIAVSMANSSKEQKTAAMRTAPKTLMTKQLNPYTIEWWQLKGYSSVEAKEMVAEMRLKSDCSLEGFIRRYGEVNGVEKYNDSKSKRMSTMIDRYGVKYALTPGRTSKESLVFFVKLYKAIRRLGFKKDDILWGIGGSKEFASHDITHNRNYFYDFTIKSCKIAVEYNGLLWHPRNETSVSPFYDTAQKLEYDAQKIKHLTDRGFNVIIVWDTDDHNEMIRKILGVIKNASDR